MMLPHLASRLYGTPLLLARAKLDIVLAVLGDRIGWPEPVSYTHLDVYKRQHYRRLSWRYGRDYDRFKADFMLAERLLARQLTVDRVVAALVSFSPGIQERCGGKVAAVRRYVTKTLIKASVTEKGASND